MSLVAGRVGFVGSHLCHRLIAAGDTVISFNNLITGHRENITTLTAHPWFTYKAHDSIKDLPPLPRVDPNFHLASPVSPRAYQLYPVETTGRLLGQCQPDWTPLDVRQGQTPRGSADGDICRGPQSQYGYRPSLHNTYGPRVCRTTA